MVTQDYCLKIQCGCISQQEAGPQNLWDCTSQFGAGVYFPNDPACVGVCPPQILPTPLIPPVQPMDVPLPDAPVLTADNVVPALPNISEVLAPAPSEPQCDWWQMLNGEISDHPVAAAAILVGAFFVFWKKRGRR